MDTNLVTVLIFLAVSLGAGACFLVMTDFLFVKSELMKQRIDNEFRRTPDNAENRAALFKNLDPASLGSATTMASLEVGLSALPQTPPDPTLRGRLDSMIEQADLRISAKQLLGLSAVLGLTIGAAATVCLGPIVGLVGAAIGASGPLVYIRIRRDRRREKFLHQIPAAFELMSRVIKSGSSVPQALQAVADAFEAPIAQEFALCQKQQNLGLRPEVTFHEMAQRTNILEMRIFVMALLIQRQTGGNLSDMLDRLAGLIRTRLKLKRTVRILTAEGRMQGLTLFVLPFVMFAAMMVVNRPYAETLLQHGSLLGATFGVMVVGAVWIKRIVSFDV
jgi:tight adherence protein B